MNMSPATSLLHQSDLIQAQGAPFSQGPVFASTYHLAGNPAGIKYQYGRFDNPTWVALEKTISELEGGPCLTFASGMGAISAALTAWVKPGDTIVLPSDGYFATRVFAENYLSKWGIHVKSIPTNQMVNTDWSGVRLVWVESPSNPGLDTVDICALAASVQQAGALLAVDNTTATALIQAPLKLGADICVASDTKALNGHSDVVFGHVAVRDEELLKPIRQWRTLVGAIPGPMEAWLVHRGLMTLDVRIERQSSNALKIAEYLSSSKHVRLVRYPGLPTDASYEIARKQMRYFGGVVGFELPSAALAQAFLSHWSLAIESTSFGGVHTTAERRMRWGSDHVSEGFIRLSVGIESINDLLTSMEKAFEKTFP